MDLFHGRVCHCVAKSTKSAHAHRPFEMVLIYQPPNAHVRISWILLRNAMAAVKKIYSVYFSVRGQHLTDMNHDVTHQIQE
jgi:hypothetical protein